MEEEDSYDDKWVLYEKLAHKVNIVVYNYGTSHLQDVMLEVRIPKIDGIEVADRMYSEPLIDSVGRIRQLSTVPRPGYPDVSEYESQTVVQSSMGDVRHHVPTPSFKEPLRIAVMQPAEGQRLTLPCTLHAKNLRRTRNYTLTILVARQARDEEFESE